MWSFTSTAKTWQASIHALTLQPYVYSYRMKLFLLRSRFIRSLVKRYVAYLLKQTRSLVQSMPRCSIPTIMTHPRLSKHHFTQLYALCRYLRPRVVVETGVGLGTSSLFILQALEDNGYGELYSIDEPCAQYCSDAGIAINESVYVDDDVVPGMLVPDTLRGAWTIVIGKSVDKLPTLCYRLGTLDLFFHDSEHTYQNMLWEYNTVWPYLETPGILASHDVQWNTAFQDFAAIQHRDPIISRNVGLIINNTIS